MRATLTCYKYLNLLKLVSCQSLVQQFGAGLRPDLGLNVDLITEQRLARRRTILETARQMIAERGYEAVTVRDLAEICRVSVPTLYNLFGGKDQLLAAAIEEHFALAMDAASSAQSEPGQERLLKLIDQTTEQLLNVPGYHQRLLEAFASLSSTLQIQERIARGLVAVVAAELSVMAAKRQLVSWASPDLVAGQMVNACIGTAIAWSAGLLPDHLLKDQMRYAQGMVVLGVFRGNAKVQMEKLVQAAQTRIETHSSVEQTPSNNKLGAN